MRNSIVVLVLCVACLWAEVPNEITYQGRLREYGQPVNGTRMMRFGVYDAVSNGTQRWTSGDVSVNVSSGVFAYTLVPTSIDWRGKDYWVETIISGKVLSPREKITAQAFALHSQTAESLTKSSGDIKFEIGATSYVVVNSGGLRLNSGAIIFPDGSSISSAGTGSAVSISNNSDAIMTADADANSSGKIQFSIGSAEKMSVQNDGKVGIGTTIPSSQLHIARESACNLAIREFSNDAIGPGIVPEKCRNTQVAPNPIQQNDVLFHVSPAPYINAAIRDIGSHIQIVAEATPSGNYVPTKIDLCTSASTANATPKVTIKSNGNVGIGTISPISKLQVEGEVKSLVNGTTFYMVPRYGIIMWSGAIVDIPSGWGLCDGKWYDPNDPAAGQSGQATTDSNHIVQTPNLTDRFILSVSNSSENPGGTGGVNSKTIGADQLPAHDHNAAIGNADTSHGHSGITTGRDSYRYQAQNAAGGRWVVADEADSARGKTDHQHDFDTGTLSQTHSHSITVNDTSKTRGNLIDFRPAYYKLAFIMKL